ncbi:MAG: hypothetical protein AAGA33_03845 [Pseudomonadota bacterium]
MLSSLTARTAATMAAFLLMTGNVPASASDTDSLRLKRDLRACIDQSLASANAQDIGDTDVVLSACEEEMRAFVATIDDEIRLGAFRTAISGYVNSQLKPVTVASESAQ